MVLSRHARRSMAMKKFWLKSRWHTLYEDEVAETSNLGDVMNALTRAILAVDLDSVERNTYTTAWLDELKTAFGTLNGIYHAAA